MEQLGLEYRALARHLQGQISRSETVKQLNRDIRRYAKRQLTYWKRNRDIRWMDLGRADSILRTVARCLH